MRGRERERGREGEREREGERVRQRFITVTMNERDVTYTHRELVRLLRETVL